jgi:hypothetical protein
MWEFDREELEESFERFVRAAAKGHEESVWILSVVKDAEMEKSALKEAFAKTEEPLGLYFAGRLSVGVGSEQLNALKKSAEGGCSWAQARYAGYFANGSLFTKKDEKVYVEWLEKAAQLRNPQAMFMLGTWFQDKGETDKALSSYLAAAELGWKESMDYASYMLRMELGGAKKDLRQAAILSARAGSGMFWPIFNSARLNFEGGKTEELDYDFNQLCYSLGWGLYWYMSESDSERNQEDQENAFPDLCLNYYCACVKLQQESIFTFLLCWNRSAGVKDVGVMIGKMVWEGREDNLLKALEAKK